MQYYSQFFFSHAKTKSPDVINEIEWWQTECSYAPELADQLRYSQVLWVGARLSWIIST